MSTKLERLNLRKTRIRSKVSGTSKVPRLTLHRSARYLYVQLIDDEHDKTLLGLSSKKLADSLVKGKKRSEIAQVLGEEFAQMASKKKVTTVVFDRSGRKYHGLVKIFAEAARKGGLKF